MPIGVFTIGPLGPWPPFELRKKSCVWQKCNQNAPFSGKTLKNFLGRGHSPLPRPYTPLGREIPLTRPLTLGAAALDFLQIFPPISIITLDSDAVIDEFGKSNRLLVLLVDLGLLNRTR